MKDYLSEAQLRALMSALSRRRKRADRPCETCGTIIPNALKRQRYCSSRCTVKAWRARRPAPDAAEED